MKTILTEDLRKLLNSVNLLMLLSCVSFALVEFLFLIPTYLYLKVDLLEFFQLFIFELGFYLVYFFGLLIIFDSIILISTLFKERVKLYYYFILLFFLSILNFIPFYIISSAILKEVTTNFSLILVAASLLSVLISAFISMVIVNSINLFKEYNQKYWTFIASVLFIIPIFLVFWGLQNFEVYSVMLLYYIYVLTLFFLLFYLSLYLSKKLEIINKINFKIVILPLLLIVIATVYLFPSSGRLEAMTKRNNIFQNSIICALSYLIDFDRDGYGPFVIVGGSDPDNFNPDLTPFSFDEPANSIDENNFGGDFIALKEVESKTLNTGKFDIVFFIAINNLSLSQINSENAPDLFDILFNSKTFKNIASYSCDRLLTILNLLNSKVVNVSLFKGNNNFNTPKENLFAILKSNKYFIQSYLDIPYSSETDILSLINNADIITANNNSYKNYVSFSKLLTDLRYHNDKHQFIFLLIDGTNIEYLNDLVKGIKHYLVENNLYDKALLTFAFIPLEPDKKECKPFNVPISFYFKGVGQSVDDTKLTSSDVLPTILDLLRIQHNPNSYIGKSFIAKFDGKDIEEKENVFIDPLYSLITVNNEKYKLIYNIKEGYLEVYDKINDPKERNNIAFTSFKGKKELYNRVDFYLNTYSK